MRVSVGADVMVAAGSHFTGVDLMDWAGAVKGTRVRGRVVNTNANVAAIPPAMASTAARIPWLWATWCGCPVRVGAPVVGEQYQQRQADDHPDTRRGQTIAEATPCRSGASPVAAAMNM